MSTTHTTTPAPGSALVAVLEGVWDAIRQRHPELPEVIIITGSGADLLGLKWGHYRHHGWQNGRFVVDSNGVVERDRRPEMFVGGETLGMGAAKTVQTMLHEATHALAKIRGVKDTSRQGRYHNRRFVQLAEELGLNYPHERPDKTIGFSAVELTDATREQYAELITELDAAITMTLELPGWAAQLLGKGQTGGAAGGHGVTGKPRKGGEGGSRALSKAVCGCEPARIIRVARSTLEQAPISCGACGRQFAVPGEPAPAAGGSAAQQPEVVVTRVVDLADKGGAKVTVDLVEQDRRRRYEVAGPGGYQAVIQDYGCACGRSGCVRCDVTGFAEQVLRSYTRQPRSRRSLPPKPAARHLVTLDGEETVSLHRLRPWTAGDLPGQYRLVCQSPRHEGGRYDELVEQSGPDSDEPERVKAAHIRWHRDMFGVSGRVELDRWIERHAHVTAPEPDRAELDRQLAIARQERRR